MSEESLGLPHWKNVNHQQKNISNYHKYNHLDDRIIDSDSSPLPGFNYTDTVLDIPVHMYVIVVFSLF